MNNNQTIEKLKQMRLGAMVDIPVILTPDHRPQNPKIPSELATTLNLLNNYKESSN